MQSLSLWRALGSALALAAGLAAAGCSRFEYVSMKPLDDAGFRYSSEKQIQELDPTKEEVAEVVKAVKGGLSETACVDLMRIARGQKRHFAEGDAVAAMHAAGISDPTIVELARLRQIPSWSGEAQAIRLTGTSEQVILAVAQKRAAGQPAPSGVSLAHMKDAGIAEATIVELVNRGITDTDAESMVFRKKRGWKDEQLLRDFPAKP
ncbi:MAG TPA: hypothetical protein VLW54_15250 [Candidatus Acidoferrales bacterium]|nr:hypothetical protein [Candidatus Acidoferrales bacterium]